MSPALAGQATMAFIVALTVLLAASVLVIVRQPAWIPAPPPGVHPDHPDDPMRAPGGDSPQHPADPPPHPGWAPNGAAQQGRHAAGPPAAARTAAARTPLPVRAPGQSGWTAPVAGGAAGRPDGAGQPDVSGGPPWGPAPRPPGPP